MMNKPYSMEVSSDIIAVSEHNVVKLMNNQKTLPGQIVLYQIVLHDLLYIV